MTPTTWFTSDLHLGHKLVAGLRGFKSTQESNVLKYPDGKIALIEYEMLPDTDAHDARLASNWDSLIRAEDTVWLLGDITLSNSYRNALEWLLARPGTKHLVLGNHDAIHPAHRGAQKNWGHRHPNWTNWTNVFASIQTFARIHLPNGQETLLSHFPYPGTSEGLDNTGKPYDDRYLQYRLIDLGVPLVHGHTHRPERLTTSQKGSKQLHIGPDAWSMCPVHISEVQEAFNAHSL